MLSLTLWNRLPSSWQTSRVGRPFPMMLGSASYFCGSVPIVQNTYGESRVYSWVMMLDRCSFRQQTWFPRLHRWILSICFLPHFWKYAISVTEEVSWRIFPKGCSYLSIEHGLSGFIHTFGKFIHLYKGRCGLLGCPYMVLFHSFKRMARLSWFNRDIWKIFSLHASGCWKWHSLYGAPLLRV